MEPFRDPWDPVRFETPDERKRRETIEGWLSAGFALAAIVTVGAIIGAVFGRR